MLARNKCLIVTSDAFLLENTVMHLSVLCLYDGFYCNCHGKDAMGFALIS